MGLFRRSRYGLGGSDIEASKCVLAQESDCRDAVEGNGHPHIAKLRKLQGYMNLLEPKGGTLDRHSFNSADAEKCLHLPRSVRVKGFSPSAWGRYQKRTQEQCRSSVAEEGQSHSSPD